MTRLISLAAAALLAAAVSPARADIVIEPATVVDHGSYVTNTVDHLDWYRFDNAANTIGLSFDAALAEFAPLGWGAASLAQVQSLQSQFGWVADSPGPGFNANYSITGAMAGLLGYTGVFFTFGIGLENTEDLRIEAMTSETFFTLPDFAGPYLGTTLSESSSSTDGHGQVFLTGDRVIGDYGQQLHDAAVTGVATWLVRSSAPIPPVPEPETWLLTAAGIVALLMRRGRRRA